MSPTLIRRGATALLLAAVSIAPAPAPAEDPRPTGPQAAPVPVDQVTARLKLPAGFQATLFAGEPDVVQPIAFTIDPRGRLWVAECYSYPEWSRDGKGRDRILIFEDTNGDGRHDKRTVFAENLVNVSGLELGHGGVYVCATPNFLHIPDADGDDRPDGPSEILLDGWSLDAQHNVFNGLTWGPDGWLYGCNGILSNSKVGKPGTPEAERVALNCGVWRFHPVRRTFEVVATGTTNPWGLDFDADGEMFITNCVIPHLFHVVPGGHYERMFGQDPDPYSYELLKTCADHVHWDTVEKWSDIRSLGVTRTTDERGGGHAHVGAMIYQGDNWPAEYRGNVFTCNVHGHRVNRDMFQPKGSTVVASHGPDFLLANDDWFRGLELQYGPDGGVYVTDWSDTGECHEHDADGAHRENGRILKISYGQTRSTPVDLAKLSDAELLGSLDHPNAWYVRTAVRLLGERAAQRVKASSAQEQAAWRQSLEQALAPRLQAIPEADARTRLRGCWLRDAIAQVDPEAAQALYREALSDPAPIVRTWAVRRLADSAGAAPAIQERLIALAGSEPSPRVRLALASALPKLDPRGEARRKLGAVLASHREDAADPMLPLMVWYGVSPTVADNLEASVQLWAQAELPAVRRLLARRMVEADPARGLALILPAIARATDPAARAEGLEGVLLAVRAQRQVEPPVVWAQAGPALRDDASPEVAERALRLGLKFGDPAAAESLRAALLDAKRAPERRERALADLASRRGPELAADLRGLVERGELLGPAIRNLAAFDDPAIARLLLDRYATLPPAAKADALEALASRPAWAKALLEAVAAGRILRREVSAATARRIAAYGDKEPGLRGQLEAAWGAVRQSGTDRQEQITRYKGLLGPGGPTIGDPARGRELFAATCAQCHKLFGQGGDLGPELTGSDRANVDYILQNVLDPSATVGGDYKLVVVGTKDGRLLTGIVREQDAQSLLVQTANERVVIPRDEIEEFRNSNESMMPEGLFDKLTEAEVRDLVSYLASPAPPPTPAR